MKKYNLIDSSDVDRKLLSNKLRKLANAIDDNSVYVSSFENSYNINEKQPMSTSLRIRYSPNEDNIDLSDCSDLFDIDQ